MKQALETIHHHLNTARTALGISDKEYDSLLNPNHVHEYVTDVELSTGAKQIQMIRVQHDNARGPYKGGIRFHQDVDTDEVKSLAAAMSIKTAVAGIPLGGGKGGAVINPKDYSADDVRLIARAWMQAMHNHVGPNKDIPAPDVNTNPDLMAAMLDEYESIKGISAPGVVTGKPLELGGSNGRVKATGYGGVVVLEEYLKRSGNTLNDKTIAIHGFGNAGSWAGITATEKGARVVAVADSTTSIICHDGLPVRDAIQKKQEGKSLKDVPGVHIGSPTDILSLDVDILVLAALEGTITDDNASSIKAPIIVELANNPITWKASNYFKEHANDIIPDVLANAGGVIVSYFEWIQNKTGERWDTSTVDKKLHELLKQATDDVLSYAQASTCTNREAAYRIALERIQSAHTLRR